MKKIMLSSEAEIIAATRQKDFREDLKNTLTSPATITIDVNGNCEMNFEPLNKRSIYFSVYVDSLFVWGCIFNISDFERMIISHMRTAWRNKTITIYLPSLPF